MGKVVLAEKYVSALALIRPSLTHLSAQQSTMETQQSTAYEHQIRLTGSTS